MLLDRRHAAVPQRLGGFFLRGDPAGVGPGRLVPLREGSARLFQRRLQRLAVVPDPGELGPDVFQFGLCLFGFPRRGTGPLLQAGPTLLAHQEFLFQRPDLVVDLVDGVLPLLEFFLLFHLDGLALLDLRLGGPNARLNGFLPLRKLPDPFPDGLGLPPQVLEGVTGDHDLHVLHLLHQPLVPLVLAHLPPQRAHAPFDLVQEIGDADQVVLGAFQLPLRQAPPRLVLVDAGGFLDELAPFQRTAVHHRFHHALLDDGVGVGAHARVQQEVGDVLEAAGHLVDLVLARARAEIAARDRDFAVFDGQHLFAVVDRQRDLCHAEGLAGGRAVEDDVFHPVAPQRSRAVLPQRPANGVDDIGLAAAVRADHGRDAVAELHLQPGGE